MAKWRGLACHHMQWGRMSLISICIAFFSPLNTAQKWMFIDISESSFFPHKAFANLIKDEAFLPLPLSLWLTTQSVLHLSRFSLPVICSISFYPFIYLWLWATVKREDWMKTLKVLFSPLISPFSPDYCVYFCSQALFILLPKICNSELWWKTAF